MHRLWHSVASVNGLLDDFVIGQTYTKKGEVKKKPKKTVV